jgi:hypothetical protein
MKFYTKFSLETEGHHDDNHPERGEQTGTISGTVSFTNTSGNIDRIDIAAYQKVGGGQSWKSYNGHVKQGSFTIPLYEYDANFNPGFNPASPVYFELDVQYTDGATYSTYIETGIYGISHDGINNVGPIGTADLSNLVVSGSVTITIPEGTIRHGRVQARSSGSPSYQGEVQSGAWVLRVPPSAVGQTLSFYVYVETKEGDHYYRNLTEPSVTVAPGGNTEIDLGTVALTQSDRY